MLLEQIITDVAVNELATRLPSLAKHDYNTIDSLMRHVAKKHKITSKALGHLFAKKYNKTPDIWVKSELGEKGGSDIEDQVDDFVRWAAAKLHLKSSPEIELSDDTEEAQQEHHTGGHTEGDNKVWIYVKNRNLVDILRTVFHELVHVRQGELNMIKSGSSYPGSPIEAMADMLAGKYLKIYGEEHHEIFQ